MGLTGQLQWSSGAAGFQHRTPLQHCTVTLLHTDLIQSDLYRVNFNIRKATVNIVT